MRLLGLLLVAVLLLAAPRMAYAETAVRAETLRVPVAAEADGSPWSWTRSGFTRTPLGRIRP